MDKAQTFSGVHMRITIESCTNQDYISCGAYLLVSSISFLSFSSSSEVHVAYKHDECMKGRVLTSRRSYVMLS
jgi:hypothetical protein